MNQDGQGSKNQRITRTSHYEESSHQDDKNFIANTFEYPRVQDTVYFQVTVLFDWLYNFPAFE